MYDLSVSHQYHLHKCNYQINGQYHGCAPILQRILIRNEYQMLLFYVTLGSLFCRGRFVKQGSNHDIADECVWNITFYAFSLLYNIILCIQTLYHMFECLNNKLELFFEEITFRKFGQDVDLISHTRQLFYALKIVYHKTYIILYIILLLLCITIVYTFQIFVHVSLQGYLYDNCVYYNSVSIQSLNFVGIIMQPSFPILTIITCHKELCYVLSFY